MKCLAGVIGDNPTGSLQLKVYFERGVRHWIFFDVIRNLGKIPRFLT